MRVSILNFSVKIFLFKKVFGKIPSDGVQQAASDCSAGDLLFFVSRRSAEDPAGLQKLGQPDQRRDQV